MNHATQIQAQTIKIQALLSDACRLASPLRSAYGNNACVMTSPGLTELLHLLQAKLDKLTVAAAHTYLADPAKRMSRHVAALLVVSPVGAIPSLFASLRAPVLDELDAIAGLVVTSPPDNIMELIEESLTGKPDDIWTMYQASLPGDLTRAEIRIVHDSFMAMLEGHFIL